MENNRIRELRKNLSLSQEALAEKIGTTQQAVSRMENNANDIPSDLLIEISKQFNVTTDYILGISDVKRDYNGQYRMNQEMDRCYDIVIRYQNLTEVNQKTLRCILERLEQAQKESGEASAKEERKNAESKNPVTGFACKLFSRWVEPTYSCLNHQAELGVKSGACLRHPPDAERPFSKKRKRNHLSCSISRLFPAKCSSVNTLFSCGSSFPIMLPTASISCSSDI